MAFIDALYPAKSSTGRQRIWVLLVAWTLTGCTVYSERAEHHFGLVLYRYATPVSGQANVGQLIHPGLLLEAGKNWGITLGLAERINVIPQQAAGSATQSSDTGWQTAPTLSSSTPPEKQWNFSFFYLRVPQASSPYFIYRTHYGLGAALGEELTALSLGMTRRTLFVPQENAISTLHFQSDDPMETRAKVWPNISATGALPNDLLEELAQ